MVSYADDGKKNYESFYQGGYSSLNPDYGNFVGYRLSSAQIGSPTGIQTANQVQEVVSRIREGVKNVEFGTIQPDIFEQIPKQHLKEIQALTKLTGVKTSVHAPLIDPAGFDGERGYRGEMGREEAERRIWSVVQKGHEADSDGNIPIVLHSTSGVPGTEYGVEKSKKPGEKGRFKEEKVTAINQETGEMTQLKREEKFYPSHGAKKLKQGGELHIPSKDIEDINATDWQGKVLNLDFYKKHADELIGDSPAILGKLIDKPVNEVAQQGSPEQQKALTKIQDANSFLINIQQSFSGLFDKAYKYGTDEQKNALRELSDDFKKKMDGVYKLGGAASVVHQRTVLDNAIKHLSAITLHGDVRDPKTNMPGFQDPKTGKIFVAQAPKVFENVENFARVKAAQTIGNVAFKSFDKFGDKAPVIAVENLYQGMAYPRAEDLEKLVKKSRKNFVEQAMESGMNKKEAKQKAEKLIGVTWDVGHLNMLRKSGFTKEDVVKETEKIAPLVKHVHITDNFGFSDSHLPPGMGNVPLKEHLKELEKAGVLGDVRTVVEAGGFVQHFKKSPHPLTLEAFGSPIYGMENAPYWNQTTNLSENYFAFPSAHLPERYFSTYGSGFSSLPHELGGQIPGTQSRFTGTPNA